MDGPFADAVDRLAEVWHELRAEHVYRLDRPTVPQALRRFVRRPAEIAPPAEGGLLDTTPLLEFVERHLGPVGEPMAAVERAVREGHLGAFAITTTSYTTGQSVTWVQGEASRVGETERWDRPMRRAIRTPLRPEHVLASASLPFFFPAVAVEDPTLGAGWYGDGGIRLTAPLSPALQPGRRPNPGRQHALRAEPGRGRRAQGGRLPATDAHPGHPDERGLSGRARPGRADAAPHQPTRRGRAARPGQRLPTRRPAGAAAVPGPRPAGDRVRGPASAVDALGHGRRCPPATAAARTGSRCSSSSPATSSD